MVAGLIALALLIGISFYQTMQLHDQMMDEIAEILLSSDISAGQRQAAGADLDELSEQFEIDYQLTLPNQLLTETDDFEGYKNQHETVLFNAEHFVVVRGGIQRYGHRWSGKCTDQSGGECPRRHCARCGSQASAHDCGSSPGRKVV